jgi:hypothetical protein
MKNKTKGAASRLAVNAETITKLADYFRNNSRRIPVTRMKLPTELCAKLRPLVNMIAEKWSLTPLQARSVVTHIALQRIFGKCLP